VVVPEGVVTVIFPVVAPDGTKAVNRWSLWNVKLAAIPLNRTAVTPVKRLPLIVTDVPTGPLVGENPLTTGPEVTLKFDELVAVPAGVRSEILPLVAPAGTVAVTRLSFWKAKAAPIPLNVTEEAPVKWLPLIVTVVPTAPDEGEKLLIVGAFPEDTVKFDELVAVPNAVVSAILPVVAPEGTVAVTRLSFWKAKAAPIPLNVTEEAPVKWLPLIVTVVPTAPDEGEKLLIVGFPEDVTEKFDELVAVPDGVVTEILPEVAPAGTVAFTCASDTKLKVAEVPLNLTALTPVRCEPLIRTGVPGAPDCGEKPEIVGPADRITKSFSLTPVPSEVVTEILPVLAPIGTVVVSCRSFMTMNVVETAPNLTADTPA
jgi:hypothetical protein